MNRKILVCALGEAAWHAVSYAGLGEAWTIGRGLAWGTRSPHRFLFGAVTLSPTACIPPEAGGPICDSWASLNSTDLPDWRPQEADPWMLRQPGRCAAPSVPDVRVERTNDVLLVERTAFMAASGHPPDRPGELHAVGSDRVANLHLLLAWRAGKAVGTAMVVVHSAGALIGAVNVRPEERHRGIGTALTVAALNIAPDRPATLSATQLGIAIYHRLGFTVWWARPFAGIHRSEEAPREPLRPYQ